MQVPFSDSSVRNEVEEVNQGGPSRPSEWYVVIRTDMETAFLLVHGHQSVEKETG